MKINSLSNDKTKIPLRINVKIQKENLPVDTVTIGSSSNIKDGGNPAFLNMAKFHSGFKGFPEDSLPAEVKNNLPICFTQERREAGENKGFLETDEGYLFTPEGASAVKIRDSKDLPPKDTFLFVLNSSGETNLAKPLIAAARNKGYKVKVIHFRKNSKEILTSQGILKEEDFIDGINMLYLPRTGRIFEKDIDSNRIVKLFGTPHHAYCRFAFSKAKKKGIPTVAFVDLGIPGTDFKYRHTFYKTLSMADRIVVPDEAVKKRLEESSSIVAEKSNINVDIGKVGTGGNPGFESFRLLVELNRAKEAEIRNELSIGKDDLVFSFSSQPIKTNGKVLETTGKALKKLVLAHPDKRIHFLMVPHPRDLHKVGLKNIFGTETDISIGEKCRIVEKEVEGCPGVTVHEMPKYTMEKASAISNMVLTESSTTAYECAHADIPSVFVRTPEQGKGTAFPAYKRIPVVDSADILMNNITSVLNSPPENLSKDLAAVVTSDLTPYLNILFD